MDLKATPSLREVKDNFGNVHRIGVLGITRSMGATDVQLETVPAPRALWMGVQETWFVVDRTLSYIGGIVVGPRNPPTSSADRSGSLRSRDRWRPSALSPIMNLVAILSVLDRPFEPVSGAPAGWWTPFVLRNRGDQGQTAVRTGAGDGLPDRSGACRHVDDFCNF